MFVDSDGNHIVSIRMESKKMKNENKNKMTKAEALEELNKLEKYIHSLPEEDQRISPPDCIKLYTDGYRINGVAIGKVDNERDEYRILCVDPGFGWRVGVTQNARFINNADYCFEEITRKEAEKLNEIVFAGGNRNCDGLCDEIKILNRYRIINQKHASDIFFCDNLLRTNVITCDDSHYYRIVKRNK